MPPSLHELGLDQLSPGDRLAVAEAIWESVKHDLEAQSVAPSQLAELERRLETGGVPAAHSTPWEAVRDQALARLGR